MTINSRHKLPFLHACRWFCCCDIFRCLSQRPSTYRCRRNHNLALSAGSAVADTKASSSRVRKASGEAVRSSVRRRSAAPTLDARPPSKARIPSIDSSLQATRHHLFLIRFSRMAVLSNVAGLRRKRACRSRAAIIAECVLAIVDRWFVSGARVACR
ncbi:hypothetical protein BKA80DRAFT_114025 [Phyllosticta citrichinensis]